MMDRSLKIIAWNVNGFRAILKKGFLEFLEEEEPDIICLQETKVDEPSLPKDLELPYPYIYWHSAEKKGYSGTAIFSKIKPIEVTREFPKAPPPLEGRVLTAEYEDFYVLSIYSPNSQDGLKRLQHRVNDWEPLLRNYLIDLKKRKPVIACGDLNVAHTDIDLSHPKQNRRSAGFTDEERFEFNNLLNKGFLDSFRELHPNESGHYSWWSLRTRARERNIGWRVDYVLVSEALKGHIQKAFILKERLGSDHAPVGVLLKPSKD